MKVCAAIASSCWTNQRFRLRNDKFVKGKFCFKNIMSRKPQPVWLYSDIRPIKHLISWTQRNTLPVNSKVRSLQDLQDSRSKSLINLKKNYFLRSVSSLHVPKEAVHFPNSRLPFLPFVSGWLNSVETIRNRRLSKRPKNINWI